MARPSGWFRAGPAPKPTTDRRWTPRWPSRAPAPNGSIWSTWMPPSVAARTPSCWRGVVGSLEVKVELSGGIRDDASRQAALATGCTRVNIGTAALEDPQWYASAIARFGDRVAVGLDVRGSTLAARGWTQDGGDLWEVLARLDAQGCALSGDRRHQGRHLAWAERRIAATGLRRHRRTGGGATRRAHRRASGLAGASTTQQ